MTDEELERLARAASPGPWGAGDGNYPGSAVRSYGDDICETADKVENEVGARRSAADAAFIAAFNPSTALALLERVRKAEAVASESAEWARALEVRIDSWRELHKEVEARAKKAEANVTLLAQQVVDALNDCNHGGGGTPVGCAGCEPMLAALREAGVEVEGVAKTWPYWRLKP